MVAVAAAAVAVGAILVAAVPRRWLGRTMLLWAASPVFVYVSIVAWEQMTRPNARYPVGTALYGFALISPVVLPAWGLMCLAGFAAGFGIRLLARLARPRAAARLPGARAAPDPGADRISPDGTIRVELAALEWANSHWVQSPRVVEAASGRIVLDLWNTDWDAAVSFPAPGQVSLNLRRYSRLGTLVALLDLRSGTYWIMSGPGEAAGPAAPLSGVAAGLEAGGGWAERLVAPPRLHPLAAWRTALLILAGAGAAIAAGAILLPPAVPRGTVRITPMPVMPQFGAQPTVRGAP